MIIVNISQYFFAYDNLGNLMRLTARGGTVVIYTSLISKAVVSVVYSKNFNKIFNRLDIFMKNVEASEQKPIKEILYKYIKNNNTLTKIVSGITGLSILVFNIYLMALFFIFYRYEI